MMKETVLSTENPFSHYVEVLGSRLHYLEMGEGEPILFLHDIPLSSYSWRHVMPHLASLGRCIALDLIGFGKSDKPDIAYSHQDHLAYLSAFIKQLQLSNITLVMHGWGSIIGFDYAMMNQQNCKGLAFYEAFLRPFANEDLSLLFKEIWLPYREQAEQQALLSHPATCIERIVQKFVIKALSAEEIKHYCTPFLHATSVKPLLTFLNELFEGKDHERVLLRIQQFSEKLQTSILPKLMLYSIPGLTTTIDTIEWAKSHLACIEVLDIGEELHLAQESNPHLMGQSLSIWFQSIEKARRD